MESMASATNNDHGDTYEEIGIDRIRIIEKLSYKVIEGLRRKVFSPDKEKVLHTRYSISQAAEMVGRTTTTIREAEKSGRLEEPSKNSRNRREGYTLEQVNKMRKEFGTLPYRNSEIDEPVVIAVQNFKGGVGKSTASVHLAQGFAKDGYRVLIIDCDPQASTTSLFGLNPDWDLKPDETLYSYMSGERANIKYAIRDTYWDQLKILPANLSLYNIEYSLAAQAINNAPALDKLRVAVNEVAGDFDIVLIDPPPALGMLSLSVLRAANALVVPVRPATVDFSSTSHFFTMLVEALEDLEGAGMYSSYKFLKILANDMDDNKSAHVELTKMMRNVYGPEMLNTVMKDSAEIDNAGARLMTAYELEKPITSKKTHDRCMVYLNSLNQEVKTLIRKTWPSQREALRQEGII